MNKKKTDVQYYNVFDDIDEYGDRCWLIEAHSTRGPGKTYSFLRGCIERKKPFIYIRRTIGEVLLCMDEESSPFVPLAEDFGWSFTYTKRFEGFYSVDCDGEFAGYLVSLSIAFKYKSLNFRMIEYVCLDEYIPRNGEKVNQKEGEMLLDFYMTISRDRVKRGQHHLILVLLANTVNLYCPITRTLGIIDTFSDMAASGEDDRYLPDRRMHLRHIRWSASIAEDDPIMIGMRDTQWGRAALGGEFAYNDFSKITRHGVKKMFCIAGFVYDKTPYWLWKAKNADKFYICQQKGEKVRIYDLDIESEQSAFYRDYVIELKNLITDGKLTFSDYSAYYLIYNYKQIYKNV